MLTPIDILSFLLFMANLFYDYNALNTKKTEQSARLLIK